MVPMVIIHNMICNIQCIMICKYHPMLTSYITSITDISLMEGEEEDEEEEDGEGE